MENIIVYAKIDGEGLIIDVNSSAHIADPAGWTEIARGVGLRYYHAQGYYFPQPIRDERGVCRYKLEDGKPALRTQEEMDADYVEPVLPQSDQERIAALEEQIDMLLAGVTSDA